MPARWRRARRQLDDRAGLRARCLAGCSRRSPPASTTRPESLARIYGLADDFGCTFTGDVADTRKETYQFIALPQRPLVAPDFARTDLLLTYGRTLLCHARTGTAAICTPIPTLTNQPPEKARGESWSTELPTMFENRFGDGRRIHFANQPGQNTSDTGHPDVQRPLERAVRHLAGDTFVGAECIAPRNVHVGLIRSRVAPDEFIVSFVNPTSAPVRPLRELLPVSDLSIALRLGGALSSHQILRAQDTCAATVEGPLVRIHLPHLDDFTAVHLPVGA